MTDVYLAVPHYGAIDPATVPAMMFPSQRHNIHLNTNGASLLAHNFNRLWCQCLNMRAERPFTHFAMLHSDVEVQQFWLDVLLDEMDDCGADILGVPVAIKDRRGLTSTGYQHPETGNVTRFTVRHLDELPETFDVHGAGAPGYHLMINTGCWVCRLGDWVEKFPGFAILDKVDRNAEGRYIPRVLSEDWNFSGWAARHGLKVMLTRKLKATHHGKAAYPIDPNWGDWIRDHGDTY